MRFSVGLWVATGALVISLGGCAANAQNKSYAGIEDQVLTSPIELNTQRIQTLEGILKRLQSSILNVRDEISSARAEREKLAEELERLKAGQSQNVMKKDLMAKDVMEKDIMEKEAMALNETQQVQKVSKPLATRIKGLRIGEHIDKTRIVLDMTVKTDFNVKLSADGKQMFLTLPKLAWDIAPKYNSSAEPVVKGWSVKIIEDEQYLVTFNLAESASIVRKSILEPRDKYYRLVIDLFSSEMHLAS